MQTPYSDVSESGKASQGNFPQTSDMAEAMAQALITAWAHQQGNYKFQTASYALYCYDHLLVFSDEVEKIWKRGFNFSSLLYLLNRYVTHFQFIINQVAFYETTWSTKVCDHFVKFEGAGTTTVFGIAETTMILRMYALYGRNKWVLGGLLTVLLAQIIVQGICLASGVRVPLPPGFPGCVLTGTVSFFGAFWVAPLVTDTCIFTLTLLRTLAYRKAHIRIPIAQQIFRDGILYFLIIFCGNLLNVILFWTAPPDLKALGASFTHIMTSLMVARLHLNLRAVSSDPPQSGTPRPPALPSQTRTFFTLGNLGEEVEVGKHVDTWEKSGAGFDETSYIDMEPGSHGIPLRPLKTRSDT